MLIKLTLIAAAVGGIWYVGKRVSGAASAVWDPLSNAVVNAAPYVTPWNPENIVNQGVTAVGNAVVSPTGAGRNADGSWTFGGWLYDNNPFEKHYIN